MATIAEHSDFRRAAPSLYSREELPGGFGQRHDLISMLKSAQAPGRPYVLLSSDEVGPGYHFNQQPPTHKIGLRTDAAKLGTYAKWLPLSDRIRRETILTEFYDYDTPGGRAELDNLVDDARIGPALEALLDPSSTASCRPAYGRYRRSQSGPTWPMQRS